MGRAACAWSRSRGPAGPWPRAARRSRDGMKIQTHTEKIRKMRKFVLELLLTNHPLDCPVCEAAGDCRLQDYAYEYLVDMVPWGWRPPEVGDPGAHPNVAHFAARCILCGRCVRICREVMSHRLLGLPEQGLRQRGRHSVSSASPGSRMRVVRPVCEHVPGRRYRRPARAAGRPGVADREDRDHLLVLCRRLPPRACTASETRSFG